MNSDCVCIITCFMHPVRQWKGFLVPVLLFCQNVRTNCLMRPSKNCPNCVRTDIWSRSEWL